MEVQRDLMIPMRDGVRLATDLYRPKGMTGALPTILIRLPTTRQRIAPPRSPADFSASHGYAVVVQDVRGKFASKGPFACTKGT
ncbi:MAG: CocE/NonD family hydrolase [Gemmatimonadetes bacterium]|nr:CocE/NonD family hydrolase [Gemmatimonadota bacterium]